MTLVSMSGGAWNCPSRASYCISAAPFLPVVPLAPLTITVSVGTDVPSSLTGQVILSAGGLSASLKVSGTASIITPCDHYAVGNTTVSDVQFVVNEALGVAAFTRDLNEDGNINVVDVQIAIDSALGQVCWAQ
jgi:hypothetical protein